LSLSMVVIAGLGSFALCRVLRTLAPRLGWLDPLPGARTLERKAQRRPAAPVGGAVLVSLSVPLAVQLDAIELALLPALLLAFAVGTLDDLLPGGLGVGAKLTAQVAIGAALAAGEVEWPLAWQQGGSALDIGLRVAATVVATLVAINALNTFDNSDGAAATVAALGLAQPAPTAAAGLLGFLPHNLLGPGLLRPGQGAPPQAYLGDAGTHLLGAWIASQPAAWPALAVPLADLARVSLLRTRAGRAPWTGDRWHLAHDLERAGWSKAARVATFAALSLPGMLGVWGVWGVWGGSQTLVWVGCALSIGATWILAARVRR
jgi:UDP-GlcNAc:undecaprenyl-phosphate GlcNAc-1-phosphate transferase